jgi:UDP-N-acetyl-2-amino-2-deoxyglucuronate dehydrogenase
MHQYEDVLDAAEQGREPLLSVDQAIRALATVRGLYVSAVLGEKVRIDDVIAGRYDDVQLRVG